MSADDYTNIRVSKKTLHYIRKLKIVPSESHEGVVIRALAALSKLKMVDYSKYFMKEVKAK